MNMIDMARMQPPPAPQPPSLKRLRMISIVLLPLSALAVALIDVIRGVSIYAVAPVPFLLLAAVVSAALYWYRRAQLEKSYWTPARQDAHLADAVRAINDKSARRAVLRAPAGRVRLRWPR